MRIKSISGVEVVVVDDGGLERRVRLAPGLEFKSSTLDAELEAKVDKVVDKWEREHQERTDKWEHAKGRGDRRKAPSPEPSKAEGTAKSEEGKPEDKASKKPLTKKAAKKTTKTTPPEARAPRPAKRVKAQPQKPSGSKKKSGKKPPAPRVKPRGRPKRKPPAPPKAPTDAKSVLVWADDEYRGKKGKAAPYKDGHWLIVPGQKAHVLFFVFEDGTFRDIDAGREAYLMDVAALYTEHGVPGRGSLDSLLDELREPDPRTRPTLREVRLTWRKADNEDGQAWMAVVPDLGRLWIRQDKEMFTVTWEPVLGGSLELPPETSLVDARRAATRHTRKVIGLAGDRVAINDLVWRETREDGRTVCYCTLKDGHFELIELVNAKDVFALYHVPKVGEWEELASGSKRQLRKLAQAFADELELEKNEKDKPKEEAQEPSTAEGETAASDSPEGSSRTSAEADNTMTDAEKTAFMKSSLKGLLEEMAEEAT